MEEKDEARTFEDEEKKTGEVLKEEGEDDDSAEPSSDGSGQDDTSDDAPSGEDGDPDADDGGDDADGETDEDPEADEDSDDDTDADSDSDSDDGGESGPSSNPFDQLVLERFRVFGITAPKGGSWTDIAEKAESGGWRSVDLAAFQRSLASNVDSCYRRITAFRFRNPDDEMVYDVWFDNERELWDFEIKDSPGAELSVDERGNLFKCSPFRKYAEWAYQQLDRAFGVFARAVSRKFEDGAFLAVDEVRMQALDYMWSGKGFRDAFRGRRYLAPDFES